jgi:DNA-binding SARP family transcriptional activator/pimeloyl-ACP methyl ester carboxylesterase
VRLGVLRLGVLGPPVLWDATGRELDVAGSLQRGLLACLVARRGQTVSADRLAELLWADQQPERPEAALQSQVHRLRRTLLPVSDTVVLSTRPGAGYALQVPDDSLDAGRFAGLVAQARAATERGDPSASLPLLDTALELWRGPAYGPYADSDIARIDAVRLEEARLAAVEVRAEALLAAGHAGDAVVELEPFVLEHPLREAGRATLMRALYQLGRHADALARYTSYRRSLADELGLEPSAAMQRLEGQILRQELPQSAATGTATATATATASVPGPREAPPRASTALDTLQSRYVRDSRGRRIAWASVGEGSPVVVVPAWVSSLEVIAAGRDPRSSVLQRLAERCRLTLYDRSGCGLSPDPPGDLSLAASVDELEAVVRCQVAPVTLFAMSQAGPVAIGLAHRAPELVDRLVLFGTYADGPSTFPDAPLKASVLAIVRAHWGIGAQVVAGFYRPGISDEGALHLAAAMRDSAPPEVAAAYLEALWAVSVLDLVHEVRTPALVLHYRRDRVIPFSGGRQLATGLPDARFLPLDGGYHLPDAADLPRIVDAVLDFVSARARVRA